MEDSCWMDKKWKWEVPDSDDEDGENSKRIYLEIGDRVYDVLRVRHAIDLCKKKHLRLAARHRRQKLLPEPDRMWLCMRTMSMDLVVLSRLSRMRVLACRLCRKAKHFWRRSTSGIHEHCRLCGKTRLLAEQKRLLGQRSLLGETAPNTP